ncbi:MAG: helix-turn-helix domain-containing protein [Candidatus Gastranaerophilaceae bacterium]
MIKNRVSIIIGERHMTISETAKLAGINYNTVYNLYYDKTKGIEFDTLNKLCFALDCTPNDLFRYIPDEI